MINKIKTIILVKEEQFRKAGRHGDELMSVLREHDEGVKDNYLTIRTNLRFNHPSNVIQAFNQYLRQLRSGGTTAIQIELE